jgi:hypothetical protein
VGVENVYGSRGLDQLISVPNVEYAFRYLFPPGVGVPCTL